MVLALVLACAAPEEGISPEVESRLAALEQRQTALEVEVRGSAAEPPPGTLDLPVEPAGEGRGTVDELAFTAALLDTTRLSLSARVVPTADGVRLSGVHRGSLPSQLGFRNGDVVRRVDGHPMFDPDAALAALAAVRDERRAEWARVFTFEFERSGQAQTLVVELR